CLSVPLPTNRKYISCLLLNLIITFANPSKYCGFPIFPPNKKTVASSGMFSFLRILFVFLSIILFIFLVLGKISILFSFIHALFSNKYFLFPSDIVPIYV